MICPKCQSSEVWDNAEKVRGGWRGPLVKCKDVDGCGYIKWPPKNQGAPKGATPPRGPKWTWESLSLTYSKCLKLANKHVLAVLPKATPADVLAAAACVFITASRDGVEAAKPAPKAESFEDFPGDDDDDSGT